MAKRRILPRDVPDASAWWTALIFGTAILSYIVMMAVIMRFAPDRFTTPSIANVLMLMLATILLGVSAFFLARIIAAVTAARHSVTGIAGTFG